MKKRGISLIVLIITIIVVIILASIIILSFNKNNPIKKAQEAKFKSELSQFKEELLMTHANNLAENKKYKSEGINVTPGDYNSLKVYIPSITKDYADRLYIKNGELAYVEPSNSEYDEDEAIWAKEVEIKTTPKVPTEWTKYIDSLTEDGVPIPKGFTYKEGTKETGVVIEDEIGNEFVWVNVDGNRVKYEMLGSTRSYDVLPSGITDESADVTLYGGFYIGRYEASSSATLNNTNSVGVPISKKGKSPWCNISFSNAKASAESMYTGSSLSVQSGLLTGKAWDTTCIWLEDDIIKLNSDSSLEDSRYYGNFNDSMSPANVNGFGSKQVTGYSEYWKVKNIYDMAGNVEEFTNAIGTTSLNCYNGGSYGDEEFTSSIIYGTYCESSYTNEGIGYRVRLYIKT